MIYIDPSELRSNSKLLKWLGPEYSPDEENDILTIASQQLPGLEAKTGADLMISPKGLPHPITDFMLRKHIEAGAYLVQIKFDHDLVSSVIDGRYKEAQIRMGEVGASPLKRVLLSVGYFTEEDGNLVVNGRKCIDVIGAKTRHWDYAVYSYCIDLWDGRGGKFDNITSATMLPKWIRAKQKALEEFSNRPTRYVYPTIDDLYEEEIDIDPTDSIQREWLLAQKLTPIKDVRLLWSVLPGIGPKKAKDIYDWLDNQGMSRNWYSFQKCLEDESLMDIKGIGKATIRKIKEFLANE